ncbi:MAG: zinc ribbon domain-containing protein, partial [Xanthomonadales bacterium]|nr:zinc ribbon domain-containing protein [Xanthomonadales bacterium]
GTRRKKSTKAGGCPACGAPTRPGARFCGQCGKPLG